MPTVLVKHKQGRYKVASTGQVQNDEPDPLGAEIARRVEQEARPVKTGWNLDDFEWFEADDQKVRRGQPAVTLTPDGIRINSLAASLLVSESVPLYLRLGLKPRTMLIVPVAEGVGIRAYPTDKGKTQNARFVACRSLIARAKELGWTVPGRYPVEYDAGHNMLVVRRPEEHKPKQDVTYNR